MSRHDSASRDGQAVRGGYQPDGGMSEQSALERAREVPADSERLLAALRASSRPMTARAAGLEIGVSKHRARDLLNRLLEQGKVGWRTDGWIPTAEDQPPATLTVDSRPAPKTDNGAGDARADRHQRRLQARQAANTRARRGRPR